MVTMMHGTARRARHSLTIASYAIVLSATVLPTAACRPVPSKAIRAPAALTLRQADSLWAQNYALHDTTRALALMADDFFMTTSNGQVKDRAAELGDVRPQRGLTMHWFRTTDVRTREYGSAGVVTGTAAWSYEQRGRTSRVQRRYSAFYTRGGPLGWQLVALHMGVAPPAARP